MPRLYSWVDYMKVRAAAKLIRDSVPTVRLREHIDWLERIDAHWYKRPLGGLGRRAHVAYDRETLREAGPGQQMVMVALVRQVLDELTDEGVLGVLSEYSDAVEMDPAVRSGSPRLRGTRLETRHVVELHERGETLKSIAEAHRVDPRKVERAAEFEERARAA